MLWHRQWGRVPHPVMAPVSFTTESYGILSTKVLLLWGNRLGSKATGFVRKPPGFGICLFKASRLPNSNYVLRTTNFPTTSQTQPVRFGELDTLRNGLILVFILTAIVSNI